MIGPYLIYYSLSSAQHGSRLRQLINIELKPHAKPAACRASPECFPSFDLSDAVKIKPYTYLTGGDLLMLCPELLA